MAGAASHLSEIEYLVEAVIVSIVNLVLHPVCFGTSISIQQDQKIHFH
jgi:hypothetical protein